MSADLVVPAILEYINHNAYPDSEDLASSTLTSTTLSSLLQALQSAQNDAKEEIRSLSRTAAPDIDTWISRAKDLQTDILRARETARQIVSEAEAADNLKADVEETGRKAELLEKEVLFNETLLGTLDHVRYADGLLNNVLDAAVKGDAETAVKRLEDAESSIAGLQGIGGSRAHDILRNRVAELRVGLGETATELWEALIAVNQEERKVTVRKDGVPADMPGAKVSDIKLDTVVWATQQLGVFGTLVQNLSRSLERAVVRPRLVVEEDESVAKVLVAGNELSCAGRSVEASIASLFVDLHAIIDFLASQLPSSVAQPLSEALIPALTTRLEDEWLAPAVPLSMLGMQLFQDVLSDVSQFADKIDEIGWHGAKALHDWVQSAPRTWLTKRRETVLGDVRNLAFVGLNKTKVVERVETQMVGRDDAIVNGLGGDEQTNGLNAGGGEDDWDNAWDEPDVNSERKEIAANQITEDDDEDASAWDTGDDDKVTEKQNEAGAADDDSSAWDMDEDETKTESANAEDEGDAWGWGDEGDSPKRSSPVAAKKVPNAVHDEKNTASIQPAERELTLRETFTVTDIPDGILEVIQQLIIDAETLAGPEFSSSPIAPASAALYTLPTLALAIYRATAPTAYGKLATGNMLLYNDSSRLADQLRSWQSSQPPTSRLRLDNDVKALDLFAKSAYSSEMEAQRTILRDLLDGAQGFGNCTVQPYKAECESAIEATVARLRDVFALWKGILSESALLQSLGSLLSTVTGKMVSEIEDLGDISEADSKQLKLLCEHVTAATDMFRQQNPHDPVTEPRDMTFVYSPAWLKFQYLAEILESSLADIKYLWHEGELRLEFGAEEVAELIEALFADSDLRRTAVREIRRG